MAAPTVRATATYTSVGTSTTHNLPVPSGTATGDRLFYGVTAGRNQASPNISWPAGWTEILDGASSDGIVMEQAVAYFDVTGTPPTTVQITSATAVGVVGQGYAFTTGTYDPATAPAIASHFNAPGNTNRDDPPSLTFPWGSEETRVGSFFSQDADFTPAGTYPFASNQFQNNSGHMFFGGCSGTVTASSVNPNDWASGESAFGTSTWAIRGATAGATDLVVADASQAQSVDSPTLTQTHNLTAQDAGQAQATDGIALTQTHVLAVQDATQGATADNVTLSVGAVDLVVADASQAQAADSPSLIQAHSLAVADAGQAQAVDSPALAQTHLLAVGDAAQAQTVDGPALTQVHVLTVADAAQAMVADNVTITVGGIDLLVADALHAHVAETPALTQVHHLAVADALHLQTADVVALDNPELVTPPQRRLSIPAEGRALTIPSDPRRTT